MSLGNSLGPAGSCQRIRLQGRAVTLDDVGDIDTAFEGAAVDECEVEILFSLFAGEILIDTARIRAAIS